MNSMGEDTEFILKILLVGCMILLPLGVWKLGEIGSWIYNNVHVSFGGEG